MDWRNLPHTLTAKQLVELQDEVTRLEEASLTAWRAVNSAERAVEQAKATHEHAQWEAEESRRALKLAETRIREG